MPNCAGLVSRAAHRSTSDATAVARLRRAGAIPLGVTNTSELCMWIESDNKVYGRTNNPYDPRCVAGGSSGGEGSIVGAGGSPFGLGSDIGGSIRGPAFFNGVFGHKPTGGLVPGSGQFPIAHGDGLRLLSTGPIARRAEDLMPLLRILAGPDGIDERCTPMPLGDPAAIAIEGLTVLDVPDDGRMPVDRELREAQARVASHLAKAGARVSIRRFAGLARSLEIWAARMAATGGEPFGTMLGGGTPLRLLPAIVDFALGRSPHTLAALGLAVIEKLPALEGETARRMIALGVQLRDEIEAALGEHGVLLFPVYTKPAPRHGAVLLPPLGWQYTAIINALELPATAVPLGLSSRGVPLGLQVVGRRGQDHVTIAVALELERAFGGWIAPGRLGESSRAPLVRQFASSSPRS
jgi:fatty acid amide hydrolase 2